MRFIDVQARCQHALGKIYGQTRGIVRRQLVATDQKPYDMQKTALEKLKSQRFLTGNRLGVPGKRAAESISAAASRKGQLHPRLAYSLVQLEEHYAALDKSLADNQSMRAGVKRAMYGYVFHVSASPLNVMLTTEAGIRIYAQSINSEPGFWADFTGGICRRVCVLSVASLCLTSFGSIVLRCSIRKQDSWSKCCILCSFCRRRRRGRLSQCLS